jgi:5-methylcytosine-specific restriction endonuclease McrA
MHKFCKNCKVESDRYSDGRCKACVLRRNLKWAAENRELRNASSRKWNAANRDKKLLTAVVYRIKNRDEINSRRKKVRVFPSEQERIKAAKRRAHKKASLGRLSKNILALLLDRQNGLCNACQEPLDGIFHLDHKMPLSRGGHNTDDNVQLLHPICNLRKYTMTHEEFLDRLKHLAPVGPQ